MQSTPEKAPIIPRGLLFGNPCRAAGKISPDGKWISWLAPSNGVLNIWISSAAETEGDWVMTKATERPIREYFWSSDSKFLLFLQDRGGDENFLLYGVEISSGKEATLTPFTDTRVEIIGVSKNIRNQLLIGLNNRDPQFHDVHLLDLTTGKLTMVMENKLYAGFIADDSLTIRLALKQNELGGTDYHKVIDNIVEPIPFSSTEMEDSLTTAPAGYTHDGSTLYWLDSRGRNTAGLFAESVKTGQRTLIAESDNADIGGTLCNPKTGVVEAFSVNYLQNEWTPISEEIGLSLAWLRKNLDGDFGISSRTDDDQTWIVWNDPVTNPTSTYIFDRRSKTLSHFYTTRPDLVGLALQPMHSIEIESRDGLTLPSYLTLPQGIERNLDGKASDSSPMVLLVHGGPWARDTYGFNAIHQMLANRGYAVLSVNFRGSTGFGKYFLNAGNRQWGLAMHDDLIDATNWAVKNGITKKDKVAIMGGSYGGYATLAGLSFTPDIFACGIDIVGPSNLETLLATIPPYWAPLVKIFHERMGDPNTEEGLRSLKSASPLHHAHKITKPLLIAQGANDPRVKQSESDQIVNALKAAAIPVTYVLYPDEGHGFANPENNIAFFAIAENFLAQCLGGRSEKIGDVLIASSTEVLWGPEYVNGLMEALNENR